MIQSDAEILLIDEVLAVGDASFQQKCADVFHEMRDSDRTVVLVTHDMNAVEHYCHRAMLIHDGEVQATGDPQEVARRYLRLNFEQAPTAAGESGGTADVVIVEAQLEGPDGGRATTVEAGTPLRLSVLLEARREVEGPTFGFALTNADGVQVAGFGLQLGPDLPDRLEPGQRVRVSGEIENRLAPGRYVVKSWIHRNHSYADLVLHSPHVLDFVVFGSDITGVVDLAHDLTAVIE
jgi:ABC-2 type transport system ATP-binding protein